MIPVLFDLMQIWTYKFELIPLDKVLANELVYFGDVCILVVFKSSMHTSTFDASIDGILNH